jgi:hypothetical protein
VYCRLYGANRTNTITAVQDVLSGKIFHNIFILWDRLFCSVDYSMTSARVMLALVLVMIAVLLAVVYFEQQECPPPPANVTPWITIDPVNDHFVGDAFIVSGKTNLAPGTNLQINVGEKTHSCPLGACCHFFWIVENISVSAGRCGVNVWYYPVNLTGADPQTCRGGGCSGYFAYVNDLQHLVSNKTGFNVEAKPQPPLHWIRGQSVLINRTIPIVETCNVPPPVKEEVGIVRVWLFGNDTVNITSVSVNPDRSYSITYDPAITESLSEGSYTLLFQYARNDSFEIAPMKGTNFILNKKGDVFLDTMWVENGRISGVEALEKIKYQLIRTNDHWHEESLIVTGPNVPI